MRILPINIQNSILRSKNNKVNNNNNKLNPNNISFKEEFVVYPRRYLPDHYWCPEVNNSFDSFTKFRDKKYLTNVIDQHIQKRKIGDKPLSIVMFDMDNFKSINELLGYKTGDDFIMETSREISSVTNKHNLPAYRFGGEEFVLVFDEKQTEEDRNKIVEEILKGIKSNNFMDSKKEEYVKNAQARLDYYNSLSSEISDLIPFETERKIYQDLRENLETKEAKNDPYLLQSIRTNKENINNLYLKLINERLYSEQEKDVLDKLEYTKNKIQNNVELDEQEEKALNVYLLSHYDKTFEIYQLKKWLNCFIANEGFGATAALVNFDDEALENKNSNDIIDELGELMKEGKNSRKGRMYIK